MVILGRVLAVSYGSSAALAVALAQAGISPTIAVLVFWLGGAAAVIALALGIAALCAPEAPPQAEPDASEPDAGDAQAFLDDRDTDGGAAGEARRTGSG